MWTGYKDALANGDPSVLVGLETERRFEQVIHNAGGYIIRKATERENCLEHWDYKVLFGTDEISKVDVKGMKALNRHGQTQSKYVCLELHGTNEHAKGWLFGGRADLIAFEVEDGFVFVWRWKLCQRVQEIVDMTKFVERSDQAIHCIYNRKGYEQVTWVELAELYKLGVVSTKLVAE